MLGPKRLVTVDGSPAIGDFFFLLVCAVAGSPERSHPAPPPTAVSARLGSSQRPGSGRVRAALAADPRPELLGPGGSGAPGTGVSTSHCVSGDGGQSPRPCRRPLSPGHPAAPPSPLSSPTAANAEGTPPPRRPRAPGRAAGAQAPRHRARPPSGPVCGARPRGREQGGETGSSPPAPPLSPPGTAGRRPCPMPASPPRHTRPAKAAIGTAPPSGRVPPDPKSSARRRAMPAAAHARLRPGRMRLQRRCPFSTFGKELRCTEMFTAQEKDIK